MLPLSRNHGRTEASFLGRFFPKGAVGVACYRHDPEKPSSFFFFLSFFCGAQSPCLCHEARRDAQFLGLVGEAPSFACIESLHGLPPHNGIGISFVLSMDAGYWMVSHGFNCAKRHRGPSRRRRSVDKPEHSLSSSVESEAP